MNEFRKSFSPSVVSEKGSFLVLLKLSALVRATMWRLYWEGFRHLRSHSVRTAKSLVESNEAA